MDKKARLASVLFTFVIILPLVGLMIMDYQLKKANDITGAYLEAPAMAYASENLVVGVVVLGAIVIILAGTVVRKMVRSRRIATTPLARINDEISVIEENMKTGSRGDGDAS